MSRTKFLFLLLIVSLCQSLNAQQNSLKIPDSLHEYEKGVFYLQLAQGNSWGELEILSSKDVRLNEFIEIKALFESGTITKIQQEFKVLSKTNEEISRIFRVHVSSPELIDEVIASLEKVPNLNFVEKIPLYRTFYTPNDPDFSDPQKNWHLTQINASQAWNTSQGCSNKTIAIVDDAVLTTHEDLSPNIFTNTGEIPNNGLDDDMNGYIDDFQGYDVADSDANPNPPNTVTSSFFSHGTHVAGIAAAKSDNNIGVASIGFNTSIIPIKTKSDNENTPGLLTNPMQGVEYAIAIGADVINISWGSYAQSQAHQLIFNSAYSSGQVTVAAAGNQGVGFIMYPAAYDNVMAIGASDQSNDAASFSNFSLGITAFAPGESIWSCLADANNSYGYASGTSMAAPIVSGLVALMLCNEPSFTPEGIQNCITNSVNFYQSTIWQGAFINIIDAEAALNCQIPFLSNCTPEGCELISNGGFEEPSNSSITVYGNLGWAAISYNQVCGWSSFLGTPDAFPNPVAQFNNYAGMYINSGLTQNDPPFIEGIVTGELNLIPGQAYMLEFDACMASFNIPLPLDSMFIGLMSNSVTVGTNPPDPLTTMSIGAIYNMQVDTLLTVYDQPDVLDGTIDMTPFFTHYTVPFTMPNVVDMQKLVFLPNGLASTGYYVNQVYIDNVSLRADMNITASSDQDTILEGNCVNLSVIGDGNEFVWEPDVLFNNPVGATQISCPDTSVYYIATAYDSVTGCTVSDTVFLYVIPNPYAGITDFGTSPSISYYPNPIVDELFIELADFTEELPFTIYDTEGKMIREGIIQPNELTQINFKSVPQGMYILKIGNGSDIQLIKLK